MEESNQITNGETLKVEDSNASGAIKNCTLCGCSTPAVRCDKCSSQVFCLSCDDMYHRHPKRRFHLRKAVDSIWNSHRSPRLRRRTELPGDPSKIPIPPPRSKKRHATLGAFSSPFDMQMFGYKNPWAQKRGMEPQRDIRNRSPLSMEANAGVENDPNSTGGTGASQLQTPRRNSADNPNSVPDSSSPIHVMVPGASPVQIRTAEGITLGYPQQMVGHSMHHSMSATDLSGVSPPQQAPPYYNLTHVHGFMHPHMPPYHPSMSQYGCPQCVSASWSNLMSPNMAHFHQHAQQWPTTQSPVSKSSHSPESDAMASRQNQSPMSGPMHFPGSYMMPPGAYAYNTGTLSPQMYTPEPPVISTVAKPTPSPSASRPEISQSIEQLEELQTSLPHVSANPGLSANGGAAEEEEVEEVVDEDAAFIIPEKPTEPWECLHCTYVNPPGSHICEICCKTSYPVPKKIVKKKPKAARQSPIEIVDDVIAMDIQEEAFVGPSHEKSIAKTEDTIVAPREEPALQGELNLIVEENTKTPIETEVSSTALTTETQTMTSTTSTDVQTDMTDAPSDDAITSPADAVTSPTDVVTSPTDVVTSPNDVVTSPNDVIVSSADVTTASADASSFAISAETTVTKREMSIQTEIENGAHTKSIATDPMISSQSMESLLSGVSAPPYHNRRAGNSFSTQSLSAFERGRSRSPMPRSSSAMGEMRSMGRGMPFLFQDPMAPSWTHSWLSSDPMYYKPHALAPSPGDDYYDGNWGSMDRLNRNVKKTEEEKWKQLPGKPRYHKSLENLKIERAPEPPFIQCLKKVKDAERCGYSVEDLQVAYFNCRNDDPIFWLQENWDSLVKNVISLAAKCAEDNEEHDVGAITPAEAKYSLHKYRGNIWEAVAECIEFRQRKILELTVRGNFTQKQIVEALKNNDGNVELAYADLIRATSKLFKHILSPGLSEESEDISIPIAPAKEILESIKLSSMQKQDSTEDEDFAPEKKRSDFLDKLTAVREAQSERRKAREEKESCRDTDKAPKEDDEQIVSSEVPDATVENISEKLTEDVLQEGLMESVEFQPSAILEHSQYDVILDETEQIPAEDYASDELVVQSKKEDELPEDFDGHWVDSQGEWIEEFSDEQWDEEGEGEWVTVRTRYKKMDDEIDAEAMEMAALWEKEELADDVFEDEPKQQKLTPEKELELKDALQSESESRWSGMDIPPAELSYPEQQEFAEDEFEMDANDNWIVKDTEKLLRSPENEMCLNEDEKTSAIVTADESVITEDNVILKLSGISRELKSNVEGKGLCDSLEGSIGDEWEKVETHKSLDSLTEELKFPEESGSNIEALELNKQAELDQNNIADTLPAQDFNMIPLPPKRRSSLRDIGTTIESQKLVFVDFKPIQPENATEGPVPPTERPMPPAENPLSPTEGPVPPVRRKSKLNDLEVKQIFEKHEIEDIKQDTGKSTEKPHNPSCFDICLSSESPVIGVDGTRETQYPPRELSPGTSFSGESDSNCFADSESEKETKARKLKKHHHRSELDKKDFSQIDNPKKIELEQEDFMDEDMEKLKLELEMKSSFAKRAHHMLDEEEPMYRPFSGPIIRMKSQESTSSVDEGTSPKAYREGVGRPLQLFKDSQQASFSEDNTAVDESIFHSASDALVFEETHASEMQSGIEYKPSSYLPEHIEQNVAVSPSTDEMLPSSQMIIENITTDQVSVPEAVEEVIPKFQPSPPQIDDIISGSFAEPEYHETVEELPALSEMEATSAVADYFFGRYNEITVTKKPKKKPILIKGPGIRPLSTSVAIKKEASPLPGTDSSHKAMENKISDSQDLSSLSKSAVAINVSEKVEVVQPISSPKQTSQVSQLPSAVSSGIPPSVAPGAPSTIPAGQLESSEALSFAEDYFFGSYNAVTVQKKPKKKPIPFLPKIPGTESISTSGISPVKKTLVRSSSSENIATSASHPTDNIITQSVRNEEVLSVKEKFIVEQQSIETSEADVTTISMETSESIAYQADAGSMTPINKFSRTRAQESDPTTESPRIIAIPSQQVEAVSKMKSVTFGQTSEIVTPPPRGKKIKKEENQTLQSIQVQPQPQGPPMSAADEYLYGRYDEILSQKNKGASVSKKKLPPSIKDLEKYSSCVPCDSDLPITYIKPLSEIAKESLLSSGTDTLPISEIQLLEVEEDNVLLDSSIPSQDILQTSEMIVAEEEINLQTSANQLVAEHSPPDLPLSSVSSNAFESQEIGVTSSVIPLDGANDSILHPVTTDNGSVKELQTAGQLNVHLHSQDNVDKEILHEADTRILQVEVVDNREMTDDSKTEIDGQEHIGPDLSKGIDEFKMYIDKDIKTSFENLEMNSTIMSQKVSEKNCMTDITADFEKDSIKNFSEIDVNPNIMKTNFETVATEDVEKDANEMTNNFEIIPSDRKSCSEIIMSPEDLDTMDIKKSVTIISSTLEADFALDEINETGIDELHFDVGTSELYVPDDSEDDVDEIAEGLEADLDAMNLALEKAIDETEDRLEADLKAMDLGLEDSIDETESSLETDLKAMDLFLERTRNEAQDGAEFSYSTFEEMENDIPEEQGIDLEENFDGSPTESDKNNYEMEDVECSEEEIIPSEGNLQLSMFSQENVEDAVHNVLMNASNDREKGTGILTKDSETNDVDIFPYPAYSKLEASTEVHQLDENGNRAEKNENFVIKYGEGQELSHDSNITSAITVPQPTASTTDQKTSEMEENDSKDVLSDDFDYNAAEIARDVVLTEDDEEEESSECTTIFIKSCGIVAAEVASKCNVEDNTLNDKQSSLNQETPHTDEEFSIEENVSTPVCDKLIEEDSILQGTCEEFEKPISLKSKLIIDSSLTSIEDQSSLMSETEIVDEILSLNTKVSSATSPVENEENYLSTTEGISEKTIDENSELSEEVPYDDSYFSVISRFYEEFIESAHPHSSTLIEVKPVCAYSSSCLELEDSYDEISDKPLKDSFQQSECSNDSFDSIEEIEMHDNLSVDILPLSQEIISLEKSDFSPLPQEIKLVEESDYSPSPQEIKLVEESDYSPLPQKIKLVQESHVPPALKMDSSTDPDEFNLQNSDFIHKTHKQSDARADQHTFSHKAQSKAAIIDEKSQMEIGMLHQEIEVTKANEPISKSTTRKRSVITIDQSCQTEIDIYEDDQFYDTLDDDLLQELIQNSEESKCVLVETGIQCQIINNFGTHRISIDNTATIKGVKQDSQMMTHITKPALPTSIDAMQEKKTATLTTDSRTDSFSKCDSEELSLQESNSFESLADDDSDIFIEMANSESDDSNVPIIRGRLRLLDIDSGTGSISGSDTEYIPDVDKGYSQVVGKACNTIDEKSRNLSSEVSDTKDSTNEKVCKEKLKEEFSLKTEQSFSTSNRTNVSYSIEGSVKTSTLLKSSEYIKKEDSMETSRKLELCSQQISDETDVELKFRRESFGDEDESFQSLDRSEVDELSMSENVVDNSHQKETRVEISQKFKPAGEKVQVSMSSKLSSTSESKDIDMSKCIDSSTLLKKVSPLSELSDDSSKDQSCTSEADVIELSEPKSFTYVTQVSPPQPILRIPSVLDVKFIEIQRSLLEDVEEKASSSETGVRASSPTVEYFLPSSPEPSSASEDSSAFKDTFSKQLDLKFDLSDTPSATPDICPDVFMHMDLPSLHSEDLWEEANSSSLLETGENFTDGSFFTDKSSLSSLLDSDQCSTASGSINDFELPGLDNSSTFEAGLQFQDNNVQAEKQATILSTLQDSKKLVKTADTTFESLTELTTESLWSTPSALETKTDNYVVSTEHDMHQTETFVYSDSHSKKEILYGNSGQKKNENEKLLMVSPSRTQREEAIVQSQSLICDSGKLDEDEPESEMADFSYHSATEASEKSYGHSDDESEEFLSSADENIRRRSLLKEKAPSDIVKYLYYDDAVEFDESEKSGADIINAGSDPKLAKETDIPCEEVQIQTGFIEISQTSSLSSTSDTDKTFHINVPQANQGNSDVFLNQKDEKADIELVDLQGFERHAVKETVMEKQIVSSEQSQVADKPILFITSDLHIDSMLAVNKLSSISKESDLSIQTGKSEECNLPLKEQGFENVKDVDFHDGSASENAVENIQHYSVDSVELLKRSLKQTADSKMTESKLLMDESTADIDEFRDVPSQIFTVDDSEEFRDVETDRSVENFKEDDFHCDQDEEDSLAMIEFEEISMPKDEPIFEFISSEIPEFGLESNLSPVPLRNITERMEEKQHNLMTEGELTDDYYLTSVTSDGEELEFGENLADVMEILNEETGKSAQKVESSSQKIVVVDKTKGEIAAVSSETNIFDSDFVPKSHEVSAESQEQPLVLKKEVEEQHEFELSVEEDFADADSYIPSEISLNEEHDQSIIYDVNLKLDVPNINDKQIADQEMFLDTKTENISEVTPLEPYESVLDPLSSLCMQGHPESLIKGHAVYSEIESVPQQASFSAQTEDECYDISHDDEFAEIDSYIASEMSVSEELEQSDSSVLLVEPLPLTENISDAKNLYQISIDEDIKPSSLIPSKFKSEDSIRSINQIGVESEDKALETSIVRLDILNLPASQSEQIPDEKSADFSVEEEFSEVDSYMASQMSVSEELDHDDLSCVASTHSSVAKSEFVNIENESMDFKLDSQQTSIPVNEQYMASLVDSLSELAPKIQAGVKLKSGLAVSDSVVGTDIKGLEMSEVTTHTIVDFKGNLLKTETEILTDATFVDVSSHSETDISDKLSVTSDISFKDTKSEEMLSFDMQNEFKQSRHLMESVLGSEDMSMEEYVSASVSRKVHELPESQEESCKFDEETLIDLSQQLSSEKVKSFQDTLFSDPSSNFVKELLMKEPSKTSGTSSDLDEDEFADASLDHSDEEWRDVESDWTSDLKDQSETILPHLQTDTFSEGISSLIAKSDLELEKLESTASTETLKRTPMKTIIDVRMKRLSATESEACFAEECELATDPEEVMILHLKPVLHEPKQAAVSDVSDIQESDQKLQQSLTTKSSDEFTKSSLDKADTIADFSEMSELSDFPTDSNDLKNVTTVSELFTSHFGPSAETFSKDAFFSNLSTSCITNDDYEEWGDVETDNSVEGFEEADHLFGSTPEQQFFGEETKFLEFESLNHAESFPYNEIQVPMQLEHIQCFDVRDEFLVRALEANQIVQTRTLLTDEEITTSLHSDVENYSEAMISSMADTNDYSMAKLDSVSTSITEKSYESIQMEDIKEFNLSQLHETAFVTELPVLEASQEALISSVAPPLVEEKGVITTREIDEAKILELFNVSQGLPSQFDKYTNIQIDEGKLSAVEQEMHISPDSKVLQGVEDIQAFAPGDVRKDVEISSRVTGYKTQELSSQIDSSVPELPTTDNSVSLVNDDFADASSNMLETQESGTWSDADEDNFSEGLEMDDAKGEDVITPVEFGIETPVLSTSEKLEDIRQRSSPDTDKREKVLPEETVLALSELISPISIIPNEQTDILLPEHSKITDEDLQQLDSSVLISHSLSIAAFPTTVYETIGNASEVSISGLTTECETTIELSEIIEITAMKDHDQSQEVSIPQQSKLQQSAIPEAKSSCLEEKENFSFFASKSVSQLEEKPVNITLKQAVSKELTRTSELSGETPISSIECTESSIVAESSHSKSDIFYDISSQLELTEELDSQDLETDNSVQDLKDDDSSVKEVMDAFSSSKTFLQVVSDEDLKTAETDEIPEVVPKSIKLSKSDILIVRSQKAEISEFFPKPIQMTVSDTLDSAAQEVEITEAVPKTFEILQPKILATEGQNAEILESRAQEAEIEEAVPKVIKSEALVTKSQTMQIEEAAPNIQMAEITEAVSKPAEIYDTIADYEDISTPVPEPIVTLQSEILNVETTKIEISEFAHQASEFEILDVAAEKSEIKDTKITKQAQSDVLGTEAQDDEVTATLPKSIELTPSESLEPWSNDNLYDEQMAYERQESDHRKFSQILTMYDFTSVYTQEDDVAEESSRDITDDLYFESRDPRTTENDLEESLYESWSDRSFELDENILQYEQETEDEFIGDQLVYDIDSIQDEEEEAILRAVDENLRKFSDHMTIEDDLQASPTEDYNLDFDRTDDNVPLLDNETYAATPEIGVFDPSLDDFTQYEYEDNSKIESFVSISNDSTTQSKELYSAEDEDEYTADDFYIKDDKYLLTDFIEESTIAENQHSIAFEIENQTVEGKSMLNQISEVPETGIFIAKPVNVVEEVSEDSIVMKSEIFSSKEILDEKLIKGLKLKDIAEHAEETSMKGEQDATALDADHSISTLAFADTSSAEISMQIEETVEMQTSSENAELNVTLRQKMKIGKSSVDGNEEISLRFDVPKQDDRSTKDVKTEEANLKLTKFDEASSDMTISNKLTDISNTTVIKKASYGEQVSTSESSVDFKISTEELASEEKAVSNLEMEALTIKLTENLKAKSETPAKESEVSSKVVESLETCEMSIPGNDNNKRDVEIFESLNIQRSSATTQSEFCKQTNEQTAQIFEQEMIMDSKIQTEKSLVKTTENLSLYDGSSTFSTKSITEDSAVELKYKLPRESAVSLQESEQEIEFTDHQNEEQTIKFTLKGQTKTAQSEEDTFSLIQSDESHKGETSFERGSELVSLMVKMSSELKDEKRAKVEDEKSVEVKEEEHVELKQEKHADVKEEKKTKVEKGKKSEIKEEKKPEVKEEKKTEIKEEEAGIKEEKKAEIKEEERAGVRDENQAEIKEEKKVEIKEEKKADIKEEKKADIKEEKKEEVKKEKETEVRDEKNVEVKDEKKKEVRDEKKSEAEEEKKAEIKEEKKAEIKEEKKAEIKDEKKAAIIEGKQAEVKEEKKVEIKEEKKVEIKEEKKAEIIEEKKAEIIEGKKTEIIEEKKAAIIEEKKAAIIEEKKAAIIEEKKAVIIEEKKAEIIEEKKTEIKEEKKAEIKEEKKAEIKEEKKAEIKEEKKAEIKEEKKAEIKEEEKAEIIDEEKAEIIDEEKAAIIEEQEAAIIEEKEAAIIEEKEAEIIEEKEAEIIKEKEAEIIEEKEAEIIEERETEVIDEKKAEVKDESSSEEKYNEIEDKKHAEEMIKGDTSVKKSQDVYETDALIYQVTETEVESKMTERRPSKEAVVTEILKDDNETLPELPRKRPNIQGFSESQEREVEIPPSLPQKMPRHRLSLSDDQKQDISSPQLEKESSEADADIPIVIRRRRSSSLKSEDSAQEVSVQPPIRRRRSRQSDTQLHQDSEQDVDSKVIMPRRISYDDERTILSRKGKLRMSIEERMSKLQSEGKCLNREKAFIAAKLIEMQFEEEDALNASIQCTTIYHAIKFLTQLCELCNCRFPINLMTSMSHCPHKACRECLKAHFTTLIYDRSVFSLLCPVCRKPDISDSNIQDYFNHLDMMLRRTLRIEVYDLFQRKLRDEVLTKDPNFHWCSQCSNGFIASPRLKKLYCPECSAITCALCHQTWELEHEGIHCERFQQWKDMHTPEPPPAGLVKKLADRGVTCPSCGIVYPHACGGCMLYKCAHCNYKFCSFCRKPYLNGMDCKESSTCKDLGLHAHHPFNCLSFLRDIDAKDFQKLFTEAKVPYATIPAPDQIVKTRCQVREQKHLHGSVTEDRCLRDIVPYFAGLCRVHYMEYLAELLRYHKISPLSIMTTMDLQFILRKSRMFIPEKVKGETLEEYHNQLAKIVTEKMPL